MFIIFNFVLIFYKAHCHSIQIQNNFSQISQELSILVNRKIYITYLYICYFLLLVLDNYCIDLNK